MQARPLPNAHAQQALHMAVTMGFAGKFVIAPEGGAGPLQMAESVIG
jgi:hypothetical protein